MGTHLVVHVLSARWLSSAEYGEFAIAFMLYQIGYVVHNALVGEPMLVLGASMFEVSSQAYQRILVRFHGVGLGLTMVMGVGALAVGTSVAQASRILSLSAIPAAVVAMLAVPLVRRRAFVEGNPSAAASVGSIYFVVTLTMLVGLRALEGRYLAWMPWLALTLGGLVAATTVWTVLDRRQERGEGRARPQDVLAAHWDIGRWLVVAGLVGFLVSGLNPVVIGFLAGMEAVGEYRAILNLATPGLQGSGSLLLLLIPYLARMDEATLLRSYRQMLVGFAAVWLVYLVVVVGLARPAVAIVYGADHYQAAQGTIIGAAALPLFYLPLGLGGALLKSVGRAREFSSVAVFAGLVGVFGSIPLVLVLGVPGAFYSTCLAYAAGGAWMSFRVREYFN